MLVLLSCFSRVLQKSAPTLALSPLGDPPPRKGFDSTAKKHGERDVAVSKYSGVVRGWTRRWIHSRATCTAYTRADFSLLWPPANVVGNFTLHPRSRPSDNGTLFIQAVAMCLADTCHRMTFLSSPSFEIVYSSYNISRALE